MNLPEKQWLRRHEAREYLGLSEGAFTKLVASGALTAKVFPGMTYAFYAREDVAAVRPQPRDQMGHGKLEMGNRNTKGAEDDDDE